MIDSGVMDQLSTADEMAGVSDNVMVRKLYWTLNIPCVPEIVSSKATAKVKRPSILQSALFDQKNVQLIDLFIKLLMMSKEHRLSDLIRNFSCFR